MLLFGKDSNSRLYDASMNRDLERCENMANKIDNENTKSLQTFFFAS